jgi:uracil-DNA glycosylase
VIIGQDPYHEPNQAHGLAFSVLEGVKLPPSLKNIYKEIESDLGIKMSNSGNLIKWAEQGVLLLNNVLTVRAHEAGSHRGMGWETFTDRVIELLAEREDPMVFVLWGAQAGAKQGLIQKAQGGKIRHLIIKAPHPSPLSAYRGFFGGRYFSRCNYFLADCGMEPVDWSL